MLATTGASVNKNGSGSWSVKTQPVSDREFRALIDQTGPYEPSPHIAVALSGGADSMALLYLCRNWARKSGGQVTALVVDHGLRVGSGRESRLVRRRAIDLGVQCHVLKWRGDKPSSGIQETARSERYRLLGDWCRRHQVLHLMVGHHRDDQVETILMRQERASGPNGLAGMSVIRETPWGRMVRPCLSLDHDRLKATLVKAKLPWVEDPSNENEAFARVRLRRDLAKSPSPAERKSTVIEAGLNSARQRIIQEKTIAGNLARAVTFYEDGFARIDHRIFRSLAAEDADRILGRVLASVAGKTRPPQRDALARMRRSFGGKGQKPGGTLGGCRLVLRHRVILVMRETGRCLPVIVTSGQSVHWDGRFRVELPKGSSMQARKYTLAPLGRAAPGVSAAIFMQLPPDIQHPTMVMRSLPTLFDHRGVVAVPHLRYMRHSRYASLAAIKLVYDPESGATDAGFVVV